MAKRIGILLYPQVEVLDFAGPYEVFTTATRVHGRRQPGVEAPFEVVLLARDGGVVRARAGLAVLGDHRLDEHPALDVLLVPGGVVEAECREAASLAWVAREAVRCEIVASVCTGVFILAAAGVLPAGLEVATHWEDIAELRHAHPQLLVAENVRWVDRGRFVTSAGISAGIDMSLHLVERLASRALAQATARQMQFDWVENAR